MQSIPSISQVRFDATTNHQNPAVQSSVFFKLAMGISSASRSNSSIRKLFIFINNYFLFIFNLHFFFSMAESYLIQRFDKNLIFIRVFLNQI